MDRRYIWWRDEGWYTKKRSKRNSQYINGNSFGIFGFGRFRGLFISAQDWCWKNDVGFNRRTIKENGKRLFDSSELIIITKCVNGCYSYKVKQILERSISFVEPYFTIRNGEIHHKLSNGNKIKFKIFVYGKKTKNDEDLMVKLIKRNQLNLNTETPEVIFLDDINILGDIVWIYI